MEKMKIKNDDDAYARARKISRISPWICSSLGVIFKLEAMEAGDWA